MLKLAKELYNRLTILIAVVLMIFVVAADAQDGELTEWQMYLIAFVIAPILTEVWKLIVAQFGKKAGKLQASIMVTVFAVVLSYFFGGDLFGNLPPIGDNVLLWIDAVLDATMALLGLATIIYNTLWDRVFDNFARGEIKLLIYTIRFRAPTRLQYRLK